MIHKRIQTVLITGGSADLGEEFCRQLAQFEITLIVVARDEKQVYNLQRRIGPTCASIEPVLADLSTVAGIARVQDIIRQRSPVDLLINNVGCSAHGSFADSNLAAQLSIVRLQIDATLSLIRGVLPYMEEQNFGHIINVSSIGAFTAMRRAAVYGATKAFLSSFSRSLRDEVISYGVKVQCLCPGMTETELQNSGAVSYLEASSMSDRLWEKPKVLVQASLEALESEKLFVIAGGDNLEAVSTEVVKLKKLIH